MISYNEALKLTLDSVIVNQNETVDLVQAAGRISGADLYGKVDSPSINASLKDGFAVLSADISEASEKNPVVLKVCGSVSAGGNFTGIFASGEAVRILSGAEVPPGADSVIAEEFTSLEGSRLIVKNTAHAGRNILPAGSDVRTGDLLVKKFTRLDPMTIGLLAAAGFDKLDVIKKPLVAIISTGDEVVAPGMPLEPGKLYASNLVTIASWCARYGFANLLKVIPDDAALIESAIKDCIENCDVILTSGGAWNGERDLIVKILDNMGWRKIFHRVRMGPGKAVAFGMLNKKPVFCLPGGPPSNHMAFIQLALPALMKMSGFQIPGLPRQKVVLSEKIQGQSDWTQFIHGRISKSNDTPLFTPVKSPSRLQMLSSTDGVVVIPEGIETIEQGEAVQMQILR
jgi:molybdopterin molybdotransferase